MCISMIVRTLVVAQTLRYPLRVQPLDVHLVNIGVPTNYEAEFDVTARMKPRGIAGQRPQAAARL